MDNILDTEVEWQTFRDAAVTDNENAIDADRYIRLNPDLGGKPPSLDDKAQMKNLRNSVHQSLQSDEGKLLVQRIAHRLIASCFYLERSGTVSDDATGAFLIGMYAVDLACPKDR